MFWRKKNRPRCTNAEPGTFNHECGKPAKWIGLRRNGLRQTFCDDCKERGWEARGVVAWEQIGEAS